jgi:hypothetical protein
VAAATDMAAVVTAALLIMKRAPRLAGGFSTTRAAP